MIRYTRLDPAFPVSEMRFSVQSNESEMPDFDAVGNLQWLASDVVRASMLHGVSPRQFMREFVMDMERMGVKLVVAHRAPRSVGEGRTKLLPMFRPRGDELVLDIAEAAEFVTRRPTW